MKKKSLSAKKIIPSNFNFKKILKDKKILEIYKNFENKFGNLSDLNKVAISVSGGPDSMALCFLVYCYKFKVNNKIQPFFYFFEIYSTILKSIMPYCRAHQRQIQQIYFYYLIFQSFFQNSYKF